MLSAVARHTWRSRSNIPHLRQVIPTRRTAATAARGTAPPAAEHDFDNAPVLRVVQKRAHERVQLLSEVSLFACMRMFYI